MTPEEKEYIRQDLINYITGTVDEWLRIADFQPSSEGQAQQYRIAWEHVTDGAMIANISEKQYEDPIVRYGVQIDVETLPDLPPIGPENDLGVYGIDESSGVYTHPDCKGEGCERCNFVGQWREPIKHAGARPPVNEVDDSLSTPGEIVYAPCRPVGCDADMHLPGCVYASEYAHWKSATLRDCLAGDRMRIGTEETDVTFSSIGTWNATTDWRPSAWTHEELILDLTANPGRKQYPAGLACEILCTQERAAVLMLQQAFPGTSPVDK